MKRLAASADVLVQNFRPGVVDRVGIGEAEIRKAKRDIVYVSISGFGERGPWVQKPVYDPIIQEGVLASPDARRGGRAAA